MNIEAGALASGATSLPSTVTGFGASATDGAMSPRNSSRRRTPLSLPPHAQSTGYTPASANTTFKPRIVSSSLSVPSSKNFSISASSASAAISCSAPSSSSTLPASSAGIGFNSGAPPSGFHTSILPLSTSITALKPAPAFTGYCTRQTLLPKLSFSASIARSKLAFSWSHLFTMNTMGFLACSARRKLFCVPTSTPPLHVSRIAAVSTT